MLRGGIRSAAETRGKISGHIRQKITLGAPPAPAAPLLGSTAQARLVP